MPVKGLVSVEMFLQYGYDYGGDVDLGTAGGVKGDDQTSCGTRVYLGRSERWPKQAVVGGRGDERGRRDEEQDGETTKDEEMKRRWTRRSLVITIINVIAGRLLRAQAKISARSIKKILRRQIRKRLLRQPHRRRRNMSKTTGSLTVRIFLLNILTIMCLTVVLYFIIGRRRAFFFFIIV